MGSHVYHPATPNYHEDALVFEECPECTRKATQGIGYFLATQDAARAARFFQRAASMGRDGLETTNDVERPLLRDAWYLIVVFERMGIDLPGLVAINRLADRYAAPSREA